MLALEHKDKYSKAISEVVKCRKPRHFTFRRIVVRVNWSFSASKVEGRERHFQQFLHNPKLCISRFLPVRLAFFIELVWEHVSCPGRKCRIFVRLSHSWFVSLWSISSSIVVCFYVLHQVVNQCKNSFIIGFSNHSNGSYCLDLIRTLKWSFRFLSTQAYNCLLVMK